MTDTEVVAESELREWATTHKINAKTVDLITCQRRSQFDGRRGTARQGGFGTIQNPARPAETSTEGPGSHRDDKGGDATCEDGAIALARDHAADTGQNQMASDTERDVYAQLMCDNLRTMQGVTGTTPTPQPVAGRGHNR